MIEEELPDELENDLDDIEPVGDESQLYEHFRVGHPHQSSSSILTERVR